MAAKTVNTVRYALVATVAASSELERQKNGLNRPQRKQLDSLARRVGSSSKSDESNQDKEPQFDDFGSESDSALIKNALFKGMPSKLADAVMQMGHQFASNADVQKGVLDVLYENGIHPDQIEGKASELSAEQSSPTPAVAAVAVDPASVAVDAAPSSSPSVIVSQDNNSQSRVLSLPLLRRVSPADLERDAEPERRGLERKRKSKRHAKKPSVILRVVTFLNRILSSFKSSKQSEPEEIKAKSRKSPKGKRRVYDSTTQVEGSTRLVVEKLGSTLLAGEERVTDLQIIHGQIEGDSQQQHDEGDTAEPEDPKHSSKLSDLVSISLTAAVFIVAIKISSAQTGAVFRSLLSVMGGGR